MIECLEDNASKEQFKRELVFMTLRPLLKDDSVAIRYAGNIQLDEWERILEKVNPMRANGQLPELAYPPSESWVIPYMYASLFILEQYRYKDLVAIQNGDVFLDCGACCGETSVWAVSKGAAKVYAFEPNPQAEKYLRENAEKYGCGRIISVSVGLGSTAGNMKVIASNGNIGGTRLEENEQGSQAQIITLDEWCRKNSVKPDFIKMDLEGMEIAALKGAQNIIKEFKPRLAVCLYHRLQDMWEIPILLKRIEPKYKFYCRKNSPYVEFVLYASI